MSHSKQFFGLLLFTVLYFPNLHAMDFFKAFLEAFQEQPVEIPTPVVRADYVPLAPVQPPTPSPQFENLTTSVVKAYDHDLIEIFKALEPEAQKNPQKPLISYLFNPQVPVVPKSQIIYGLNNEKFNENDLWWVIRHREKSPSHGKLFKEFVLDLDQKFRPDLLYYMSEVSIPKSEEKADQEIRHETLNIFAAMIEAGFLTSLKDILKAYPESANSIINDNACTREERDAVSGIPLINRQYTYKPHSYKLIPWLIGRLINTGKTIFGAEIPPEKKYIDAANMIAALYKEVCNDNVKYLVQVMTEKKYLAK